MKKLPLFPVLAAFIALAALTVFALPVFAQGPPSLKEGIELYNQESYEEAITVLTRARQEDPASAEAAFYLGMAYRQSNDIPNAHRQFKEAVTLKPLSDNAILELIETSTLMNDFDTAREWIGIAEQHNVYHARVAFLKGTSLAKQGKIEEAIAAYETCKKLDASYTQSADVQIGVCYMNQRKFALARERFQAAVTQDPLTSMAENARRYQDAAEYLRFVERPLRLTIGVTGQYDSNYQLLADDAPEPFATFLDSMNRRSWVMQNMVRLDYVPQLPAPFVFTAGYTALNALHERYSTNNDTFANSFTLAPGVNFDSIAVNLVGNYTHNLKRGHNPPVFEATDNSSAGYRRYSESASIGPLFRYLLSKNQIFEAYGAYVKKNFFFEVFNPGLEDRSASGFDGFLGWVWFFKENALLNLKVGYTRDNANGVNYSNGGYRYSATVIYPLIDKLRLQVGGEVYLQDYDNQNVIFDNIVRKDRIYTGTIGLTWSVLQYMDVIAQYLYTRSDSNIFAYDYKRDIYSLGVEIKF
jgi:tetratricopeptide (TPR) repeat protein